MNPSKKEQLHKLWKLLLVLVGIFLSLHFLQDITQDLLKIQTPLDYMGDIQENVSILPIWVLPIYYGSWILATIAEPIIVYFIFKTWKHNTFNKNDKIICLLLLYFLAMVVWAFTLAP